MNTNIIKNPISIWLCIFTIYFLMHVQISMIDSLFSAIVMVASQIFLFYISKNIFIPRYLEINQKKFTLIELFIILVSSGLVTWIEYLFFTYISTTADPDTPYFLIYIFKLIIYAITIWVSVSIYIIERERKTNKKMQILKNEKALSELKFLKAQINPHFLFNALNNIYSMSYMEDKSAPDKIAMLSEMLRYVIYDCKSDFVPLEKELIYLENFIEFQKLRTENEQQIEIDICVKDPKYKIAPMILIPFVENAFKHSRICKYQNAFVSIYLIQNSNTLEFDVTNSNIHPAINTGSSSSGIGIENIKNRLELIYGKRAKLDIQVKKDIYSVNLKIELNE